VVDVIFDAFGNKLEQQKQIDLADNSMIYIKDCLKDPDIRQPKNSQ